MPELIEVSRTGMLVEDFIEGYHQVRRCFEMDREYIAHRARLLFNYRTMSRQYVLAYERTAELFRARREQHRRNQALRVETRSDLDVLWRERGGGEDRLGWEPALNER